MDELLKRLEEHFINKIPFVVFASPDSKELKAYLQKGQTSHSQEVIKKNAFIFQPFNTVKGGFAIPKENADVISTTFEGSRPKPKPLGIEPTANEQELYEALVNKALQWIESNKSMKIVTSRRHAIKIGKLTLSHLIHSLFSLYPTAFRYVWYHPETGLWCGASPELLLESDGECFKTMAMAGTQRNDSVGRIDWTDKEREEQQLVVNDITDKLQKVLSVIKISKTMNHWAGPVVHLRTDISGCVKKGKHTLFDIAQTLHPTPAVCGTPMAKARKFIDMYEGYDREFYTGYLGNLGDKDEESSLYVNLRCMKIESGIASIYVGGGITRGSDAKAEWHETENKLHTMFQVVQSIL